MMYEDLPCTTVLLQPPVGDISGQVNDGHDPILVAALAERFELRPPPGSRLPGGGHQIHQGSSGPCDLK